MNGQVCVVCGEAFDGRKRTYCSVVCRRNIEFERRRAEYEKAGGHFQNYHCKTCGITFRGGKGIGQTYCSDACRPNKKCKSCGKEYETGGYKFCSDECRPAYKPKYMKNCSVCGKELKRHKKYCTECDIKLNKRWPKETRVCGQCGKQFEGRKKKFCSIECRHRARWPMPVAVKQCAHCKKDYKTTSKPRKYCSLSCRKRAGMKRDTANLNSYIHGTKYKENRSIYERERRRQDVHYNIKCRMRSLIFHSLRRGKEGKKWSSLLGYTVDELKHHLERQFTKGMTWQRFLDGEIHIDHRIPVSAFNFASENDIDFKRCWAINNLQPMWARENISKGNKILYPFHPSLGMVVSM